MRYGREMIQRKEQTNSLNETPNNLLTVVAPGSQQFTHNYIRSYLRIPRPHITGNNYDHIIPTLCGGVQYNTSALLYFTKLCYTILYYTIPYYSILDYIISYHTILYYIILHYAILYNRHYTIYTHITQDSIVQYGHDNRL